MGGALVSVAKKCAFGRFSVCPCLSVSLPKKGNESQRMDRQLTVYLHGVAQKPGKGTLLFKVQSSTLQTLLSRHWAEQKRYIGSPFQEHEVVLMQKTSELATHKDRLLCAHLFCLFICIH